MSSVLVGMFDTQSSALAARDKLIGSGFASSAVSMTPSGGSLTGESSSTSTSASSGSSRSDGEHEGAIAHFFRNLFGSDDDKHDAERANHTSTYSEAFKRGSYGLSVTVMDDDESDKAEQILNDCGAVDIDEKAESWRKEGWTGSASTNSAAAMDTSTALQSGGSQKLQELQEELKVGKRAVSRGGVRVFTRMTEVPVTETVRLREEHADVKRTAVDRPATAADFSAFKEGSIEVREMSEEAVVSKTARVVGEVEVGKTATERDETVRDTVRKTKVEVEQLDGSAGQTKEPGSQSGAGGAPSVGTTYGGLNKQNSPGSQGSAST
jgi:uncharacterized protein (TIGR02271 family)